MCTVRCLHTHHICLQTVHTMILVVKCAAHIVKVIEAQVFLVFGWKISPASRWDLCYTSNKTKSSALVADMHLTSHSISAFSRSTTQWLLTQETLYFMDRLMTYFIERQLKLKCHMQTKIRCFSNFIPSRPTPFFLARSGLGYIIGVAWRVRMEW